MNLTDRESEVLETLASMIKSGICPTMGEIGSRLGVTRSRVQQLIASLVEKGRVEREPRRARSMRVIT